MLQAYSSNPDVTFTFEFKANAVEQLEALILEHITHGVKSYFETEETLEKSPKVFIRALGEVMKHENLSHEQAIAWLADDNNPYWQ